MMSAASPRESIARDVSDNIHRPEEHTKRSWSPHRLGRNYSSPLDMYLDEDNPSSLSVPQIFGNINVSGRAFAHLGDINNQNFFKINCQCFSQSHGSNFNCREWLGKLKTTTDQAGHYVHIERKLADEDISLTPLTTLNSHGSGMTLVEDVPLDWLSDHIFEDFTCDISRCICECHQSKRVTTEGLLGGRLYIKEARFDPGHQCQRDGKIDYIRTLAIWLPKWIAIKRLVQVTKNRSLGTWWLPDLPKLVGDQAIFHYASTGNKTAMQQLLRGSTGTKGIRFDPNVIRQENGWTALHYALEAGQYEICETLIKFGAKPNMETVLFSGTAAYLAVTKILIHYSDPEIRKRLARTFEGKLENERLKLSKLHKIVIFKPGDAVRQINLLEEDDLQVLLKSTDRTGKTALCWAAQLNRAEVVRALLLKGADIDHQDFDGNTPFHFASQAAGGGPLALAQLLSFDPQNNHHYAAIRNKGGWQPLHQAAQYQSDPQFAELLVQAGASVHAETKTGKTPVMMAALWQKPNVIRFLNENRADLNHQDRAGWTALSLAIDNIGASLETIDALLDARVSLHGQSIRQETILHLVAKMPSLRVLEHLVYKARLRGNGSLLGLGYVDAEACNSQGFTAKQLLMDRKPVEDIERAFDTLQNLMDASLVQLASASGYRD